MRISLTGYTLICVWTGVSSLREIAEGRHRLPEAVEVASVLAMCAAMWTVGVCMARWMKRLHRPWSVARALSVWVVGVYFLFSQDALRFQLYERFGVVGFRAAWINALVTAGALGVAWLLSKYEPVRVTFTVSAGLLVIFVPLTAIPRTLDAAREAPGSRTRIVGAEGVGGASARENVYFVVLDEYGGAAALRRYFRYENLGFLGEMTARGYSHLNRSRANYTVTYVSLAATLGMNYVLGEGDARYRDRGRFFPSIFMQDRPPDLVRRVNAKGYRFVHVGNDWARCRARRGISCLGNLPGNLQTVEDAVLEYLAPTKAVSTFRETGRRAGILPSDGRGNDAIAALLEHLREIASRKEPSFVFVHHLFPHEPLNADCSAFLGEPSRKTYTDTVGCVNRSVLSLASRIQELDPSALVVFQGDHGSGFSVDWRGALADWSDDAIDERTSILNLVRVPEACREWVRPNLSPINTMRLVLGCMERRPPDYLEDRTYLATYETSPDFGVVKEVTGRVALIGTPRK